MLLFILHSQHCFPAFVSFNTSHVVIYQMCLLHFLIFHSSFNTSHVVIYLEKKEQFHMIERFQYISCCYLSLNSPKLVCILDKFQYISCCYLSRRCLLQYNLLHFVSIHLMLLFIRKQNSVIFRTGISFNTSHVVVYRVYTFSVTSVMLVSIHLMLLFILMDIYGTVMNYSFNTSHVVIYPLFQLYQLI